MLSYSRADLTSWFVRLHGPGCHGAIFVMALLLPLSRHCRGIESDDLPDSRYLFEQFGISSSEFAKLSDGEPLDEMERATVERILFRLPQISLRFVSRWTKENQDWGVLAGPNYEARGKFFRGTGKMLSVARETIDPQRSRGFDFHEYFRVDIALDEERGRATVLTRSIPNAWHSFIGVGNPPRDSCSFNGVFLKELVNDASPHWLLAASRIAWHPRQPAPDRGVSPSLVSLAQRGVDIGLFDNLRQGSPMNAEDRECFYHLLDAVGRADGKWHGQIALPQLKVADLLQNPKRHVGQFFRVDGVARSVLKIRVDDRDIQDRLGIRHYFQIDMMVPLEVPIKFVDPTSEVEDRLFASSYPATVCVLALPDDLPRGGRIEEAISVTGCFMKLWAYRNRLLSEDANQQSASSNPVNRRTQLQKAPLLIGMMPRVNRMVARRNHVAGIVIGIGFLGILAAVWFATWRSYRGDRMSRSRSRHPRDTSLSFSEVEQAVQDDLKDNPT